MRHILLLGLLFTVGSAIAQEEFKLDKSYSIDRNGTITVRTDDADIKIIGSNRSDVHVDIYRKVTTTGVQFGSKEFEVEVNEQSGDLYIEERSSSSGVQMGSTREIYKITIEAPRFASLDLKGDDDDYEINGIDGAIKLSADDGDATLTDCKGSRFELKLDDGDVNMDTGSGTLYVDIDDGDLSINNGSFFKIDASVDDGDLRLTTSLDDDGEYYFRVDDGLLDLKVAGGGGKFDIRHDDSRVNSAGGFELVEKDENYTILRSESGSATVKIKSDDASIRIANL